MNMLISSALIGLVLGILYIFLQPHKFNYKCEKINIQIPQFSELSFVINDSSKRVAWVLFIETITRISTQPLKENDGYIKEALNSLYTLFSTTREILKTMSPSDNTSRDGATIEMLAISMLNNELRPFLSKWHPKLEEYIRSTGKSELEWAEKDECRKELAEARSNILKYAKGFGELAEIEDLDNYFKQS